MSTSFTNALSLAETVEQARSEFSLPEGAGTLIAADAGSEQVLNRWLRSDAALAERLLRWCNTPLYNRSKPFASLDEAARVLQRRDLSRLAVLACVRGLLLPDLTIDLYQREVLWSHSIAVGAVASMISRTIGSRDPGVALIAGTLHDIGLAASERLNPHPFAEVISEIDEFSLTHQVERDLLGWDHAQLGAGILEQWGMPEEVQMVARYHHSPEEALDGPYAESIGCVVIANYFCSRSGWASTNSRNRTPPSNRVFRRLEVDEGLLTVLWQQLQPALDSVAAMR
jgi:putative nucleotidyltransferase with HDIG domain